MRHVDPFDDIVPVLTLAPSKTAAEAVVVRSSRPHKPFDLSSGVWSQVESRAMDLRG